MGWKMICSDESFLRCGCRPDGFIYVVKYGLCASGGLTRWRLSVQFIYTGTLDKRWSTELVWCYIVIVRDMTDRISSLKGLAFKISPR